MPKVKHKFHEHVSRSLVKAITFRMLVLVFDGLLIFMITGRYDITVRLVLLANLIHTVVFFVHERMWNSVHWGKHKK